MSSNPTLSELRAEFCQSRMIAMPIAGTIAWTVAGVLGAMLPVGSAAIALFVCTGMIFPLGIVVGKLLGEDVLRSGNELDSLFGHTIAMALLVWAIGIPFYIVEPSSLPLSVGVLAGLMWVPFSWMIQHWIGLFHGIARTVLVVAVWYMFPARRFVAVPVVIVVIYLISIYVLATRQKGGSRR
jgi:hypothetical protein